MEEGKVLLENLESDLKNNPTRKVEFEKFCNKLIALNKKGHFVEQLLKIKAKKEKSQWLIYISL